MIACARSCALSRGGREAETIAAVHGGACWFGQARPVPVRASKLLARQAWRDGLQLESAPPLDENPWHMERPGGHTPLADSKGEEQGPPRPSRSCRPSRPCAHAKPSSQWVWRRTSLAPPTHFRPHPQPYNNRAFTLAHCSHPTLIAPAGCRGPARAPGGASRPAGGSPGGGRGAARGAPGAHGGQGGGLCGAGAGGQGGGGWWCVLAFVCVGGWVWVWR